MEDMTQTEQEPAEDAEGELEPAEDAEGEQEPAEDAEGEQEPAEDELLSGKVPVVLEAAASMTDEEIAALIEQEHAGQGRKTLIEGLDHILLQRDESEDEDTVPEDTEPEEGTIVVASQPGEQEAVVIPLEGTHKHNVSATGRTAVHPAQRR